MGLPGPFLLNLRPALSIETGLRAGLTVRRDVGKVLPGS